LCPSAVSRFKSGGAARTVALGRDGSLGARAMSGDEAKLERLLEMLEASVRPRARTRPVVSSREKIQAPPPPRALVVERTRRDAAVVVPRAT